MIGPAHYNQWRAHFGESLPGAGSLTSIVAVPPQEMPALVALAVMPAATNDVVLHVGDSRVERCASNYGPTRLSIAD